MKERGLIFVGIDVIGDYLTEINVTSPTGIQEINRLDGAALENECGTRSRNGCADLFQVALAAATDDPANRSSRLAPAGSVRRARERVVGRARESAKSKGHVARLPLDFADRTCDRP